MRNSIPSPMLRSADLFPGNPHPFSHRRFLVSFLLQHTGNSNLRRHRILRLSPLKPALSPLPPLPQQVHSSRTLVDASTQLSSDSEDCIPGLLVSRFRGSFYRASILTKRSQVSPLRQLTKTPIVTLTNGRNSDHCPRISRLISIRPSRQSPPKPSNHSSPSPSLGPSIASSHVSSR